MVIAMDASPAADTSPLADKPLDPRAVRHIGLDVGTTNTSLCYTTYNQGLGEFDLPKAARLGQDDAFLRSTLLLDNDGAPLAYGDDAYRHPAYHAARGVVHEEFKLGLGQDDRAAERLVTTLVTEAARKACRHLRIDSLAPEAVITNVGIPAEWARHEYHRAEAMMRAVDAAGLPNVGIVPEPVAAMLYHARVGDIVFDQHPQFWLVIDLGGGTTDVAVVETRPGPVPPVVRHTFGRTYGGRDFDQLLLEKVILPRVRPDRPPTPAEMPDLSRAARRFKEGFSLRMDEGHQRARIAVELDGRKQMIELTREAFESSQMAGPLIDRFARLLRQGFRDIGLPLGDIDRVILTGGSARWYFVGQTAERFFGRDICLRSPEPELTIAQGLALARTGFAMPIRAGAPPPPAPAPPPPRPDPATIELTSITDQPLDLAQCRQQATQTIRKMAALAGGVALVLSPIPGVSQIPLTSIEAKMVLNVATIYGYKLDERQLVAIVGGLLAGGTAAKIVVMETATFIPVIGTIVKTAVGGGAALGFGQLAIEYFEKRRRAEQGDGI